jgi:hypothetical protein
MSCPGKVALLSIVLFAATMGNAASRNEMMRITVLDSVTRALPLNDNGVPQNCDQATFDAYCRSTRTAPLVSTLLVQEGDNPPFRITCNIESRYSRCQPLPLGATFEARREKRGITVYYIDDKGKPRKELYTLIDGTGKGASRPVAATVATTGSLASTGSAAPLSATPRQPSATGSVVRPARADASASTQNSTTTATPPGPGWVQVVNPEKVKCNFSSTPVGAEVTVDGQYVGNTPSRVPLSIGAHTVTFSLTGFASWKRDLTVISGSELNINTALQKVQ